MELTCSLPNQKKTLKDTNEMNLNNIRKENDKLKTEYGNLKYAAAQNKEQLNQALSSFKYALKSENWKIIDFDNYMKGNELIRRSVMIDHLDD